MFTGIVEETGTIKKIEKGTSSGRLTVEADKVLQGSEIGLIFMFTFSTLSVASSRLTTDISPTSSCESFNSIVQK